METDSSPLEHKGAAIKTTLISKQVAIHGLILALIDLVALYIGLAWDTWTHRQHPFAAQIPLSALIAIVGFPIWYRLTSAFSSGRLALGGQNEWYRTYAIALICGPFLFVSLGIVVHAQSPSLGRIFTLFIFQGLVNMMSLHVAFTTRNFDFPGFVRNCIERPWISRIFAVFLGIGISVAVLVIIEGSFYVLNTTSPAKPEKIYEGEYLLPGRFFQQDELLGASLKPNEAVTSILKIGEAPIWDVVYTTDTYGRRKTVAAKSSGNSKFAMFFGGSFTFGEGSNDNQTIPSRFGSDTRRFRAYNYSVPGYGPQQMLAKLQSGSLKKEISEENGVLFFIYLEGVHEGRVVGQMNVVNTWGARFPYYDLNMEGNLEYKGTFTTGRPILSPVFRLLGKTQLARYLGLNLPNLGEEHYGLTARIIEESRKLYEKQFTNSEFYVVLFPNRNPHRKIVPYLEQSGTKYLDYFNLFDPNADGYSFIGDGHPTPKANSLLANQLA